MKLQNVFWNRMKIMDKQNKHISIFTIIGISIFTIIGISIFTIIGIYTVHWLIYVRSNRLDLYAEIESYYIEKCENKKDTCVLFLKDITDFEWDWFNFIPLDTKYDKVLDFPYYPIFEFPGLSYFIKKGENLYKNEHISIYNPDNYSNFSKYPKRRNMFISYTIVSNKNKYLELSPDNAIFHIKKEEKKYYLYPISTFNKK